MLINYDMKYFVPFPEFFKDLDWNSELYLGIDTFYKGVPITINILFTKSEDLEEIKKSAKTDYEQVKIISIEQETLLAVQKIYETLHFKEPSEPKFKLLFEQGYDSFSLSEKEKTLTIFVNSNKLPNPKKVFFYSADV